MQKYYASQSPWKQTITNYIFNLSFMTCLNIAASIWDNSFIKYCIFVKRDINFVLVLIAIGTQREPHKLAFT